MSSSSRDSSAPSTPRSINTQFSPNLSTASTSPSIPSWSPTTTMMPKSPSKSNTYFETINPYLQTFQTTFWIWILYLKQILMHVISHFSEKGSTSEPGTENTNSVPETLNDSRQESDLELSGVKITAREGRSQAGSVGSANNSDNERRPKTKTGSRGTGFSEPFCKRM